jgi:hypothetical protein
MSIETNQPMISINIDDSGIMEITYANYVTCTEIKASTITLLADDAEQLAESIAQAISNFRFQQGS